MALGSLSPVHLDCLASPSPSLLLPLSVSRARGPPTPRPPSTLSRLPRPLAASSISSYTLLRSYTSFTTFSRQRNLCLGFHSSSLSLFRNPLARLATRQQSNTLASLSLSLFFFLSPSVALLFFPRSPEVRLATSYPKRRKLPVNVISLLIRFSSRFSRTADPTPPSP